MAVFHETAREPRDPGHRQVLHDQVPFQRPPRTTASSSADDAGGDAGVLGTGAAAAASVPGARRDQQRRGPPPANGSCARVRRTRVRACALRSHTGDTSDPASTTRQAEHRPVRLEALPGHLQAQSSSRQNVVSSGPNPAAGSVGHVEVFLMGGVRTPILGRPRPLPADRHAAS